MNRKEVNLVKQKVYSFVSTQFVKILEVLKMLSLTTTEYNDDLTSKFPCDTKPDGYELAETLYNKVLNVSQ